MKEPTEPDRPHSYNEVDAYNDPESDSFKYRIDKEKYRDEYLIHLKEKDQIREHEMQKQYQALALKLKRALSCDTIVVDKYRAPPQVVSRSC